MSEYDPLPELRPVRLRGKGMTIFLVIGESGWAADKQQWVVGAFVTRDDAQAHADKAARRATRLRRLHNLWGRLRRPRPRTWTTWLNADGYPRIGANPYDLGMVFSPDGVWYSVVSIPFHHSEVRQP